MSAEEEKLLLPFDQFSRQFYASKIADSLRAVSGVDSLSILDIGGYKGKTATFQLHDTVTITDLQDISAPGYVRTNGRTLPFEKNSFDVSMSFDTYEHVPREQRGSFIENALNVSRSVHILAGPFEDNFRNVARAELVANEIYKKLFGVEHRWLKEHELFGLSTAKEFENFCAKKKIAFFKIRSNDIALWLRLQAVFFTAEKFSKVYPSVDKINQTYNRNIAYLESQLTRPVYRTIYCIGRNATQVKRIQEHYEENVPILIHHGRYCDAMYALEREIHAAYLNLLS